MNLSETPMITRLIKLPQEESFFLFGPRSVGKTTIIKSLPWFHNALYINLLLASGEKEYSKNPDRLLNIVEALPETTTHIIIDEVQKIPKLLDLIHELIETTDKKGPLALAVIIQVMIEPRAKSLNKTHRA
jgi:predicted AAA+ superfamily ATPase